MAGSEMRRTHADTIEPLIAAATPDEFGRYVREAASPIAEPREE